MSIYAKTGLTVIPGSCAECVFGKRYGLVGDKYCEILGEYFTGNVKPPHKIRPDECPLVELPASMEAQPNEPLTMQELREMDGQPVWIDFAGGLWALVDAPNYRLWAGRAGQYDMHTYTERVYRRPPKED